MITINQWFTNRYTSLAEKTARERLAIRRVAKHAEFHKGFHSAIAEQYRNQTGDQKQILDGRILGLLP